MRVLFDVEAEHHLMVAAVVGKLVAACCFLVRVILRIVAIDAGPVIVGLPPLK